jgi:hypothetical protein
VHAGRQVQRLRARDGNIRLSHGGSTSAWMQVASSATTMGV